eukprot:6462227-Amphidinium_carterae.2
MMPDTCAHALSTEIWVPEKRLGAAGFKAHRVKNIEVVEEAGRLWLSSWPPHAGFCRVVGCTTRWTFSSCNLRKGLRKPTINVNPN